MNVQDNVNAETSVPQTVVNPVKHLTAPKICHNMNCGFQTHEPLTKCPKCKRPMWTTNEFRVISSLLVVCGLLFLLIGGGLGYIAYRNYAYTENITEKHQTGIYFLSAISIFLTAFGLTVITAGGWQVIFGRANKRLIVITITFLIVFFLIVGSGRLILSLLGW